MTVAQYWDRNFWTEKAATPHALTLLVFGMNTTFIFPATVAEAAEKDLPRAMRNFVGFLKRNEIA